MATKIKINKGDKVRIIAGSQKGTEGSVLNINKENNKAIVEGVNLVKKHNLDQKNVYFYTDSFQDLPLLKWAGHSYLIRPNFIMKYLAEYYNFKIINN